MTRYTVHMTSPRGQKYSISVTAYTEKQARTIAEQTGGRVIQITQQ